MVLINGKMKEQAKQTIRGRVFSIFLVLFVLGLVISGISYVRSVYGNVMELRNLAQMLQNDYLPGLAEDGAYIRFTFGSYSGGWLFTLWGLLVLPLSVARIHFTMKVARGEKLAVGNAIGGAFREGFQNYGRYFGTAFVTSILIFLHYLLLIVPGIIKSYEYYFVNYLQAEYPQLSGEQCRRLSSRMTKGYKLDIFVTQLSFIGWWLLYPITLGLAGIYVTPYYCTTMAIIYDKIKDDALQSGKILPHELGLAPAPFAPWMQSPLQAYAQPPYAVSAAPLWNQNTPQSLKQAVVNAHPGGKVLRSGVPALPWQEAIALVEECGRNGFVILGIDVYTPNGSFAPQHGTQINAAYAQNRDTWVAAAQFITEKARSFELYYEIIF